MRILLYYRNAIAWVLFITFASMLIYSNSAKAFTFSQTRGVIERVMKNNDKIPNKSFYCDADIDFSVKKLNRSDLEAGLMQIDPLSFNWDPALEGDGDVDLRARRKELEHLKEASGLLDHLDDWALGRIEAAKINEFINRVVNWPHNLRWINGRINLDRSNKMFGENITGKTYGNCDIVVSHGKNGQFSPPKSKRGDIARATLGIYERFHSGMEIDGQWLYLNPLEPSQRLILERWNSIDPPDATEILMHKLIAREWERVELKNARRNAKLFCKGLDNETQCFNAELERMKNIVAGMEFENPMLKGVKLE